MSLARNDIEPLREVFDNLRLPNVPTVVVYQNTIKGHFYKDPIILGSGTATLNVGDVGRMCKFSMFSLEETQLDGYGVIPWLELVRLMTSSAASHRNRSHTQPDTVTPDPSDQDAGDVYRPGLPFIAEAPPEYRTRDYDWFTPGRYLKIWAREGDNVDVEIHGKDFVLLDTKNIEGPALLVRRLTTEHCERHRGSFNRTHVHIQNYQAPTARSSTSAQSRRKVVYMDEEEDDVAENTFIELEHTYNIPFAKYKCIDYGVITRSSLRELRRLYVEWLKYQWDLE